MHPQHPHSRLLARARIAALILCLIVCLAVSNNAAPPVLADSIQSGTTFTVNDPADPGGATCQVSACSLRAAISAAYAGGLPAGYTITFNLTTPVQIVLSASLPDISARINITGPGPDALAINGGGLVRIFTTLSGSSLTLSGLTLTQGWNGVEGGGAIRNGGSLSMTDLIIASNLAGGGNGGGLLNDVGGDAQITRVDFLDNDSFHDGAIANSGSITITQSIFSGNTGRVGGAIENFPGSSMTITASAFTNNVAKISSGGAIANGGSLVIANSTFSQNGSPLGADIANGGPLHVTNSTFFGAISPSSNSIAAGGAGSTLVFRNNILATSAGVANCLSQGGGSFSVDGSNLATDPTCGLATVVLPAQLMLGPLALYGGVPGLALLPGSIAIDAADDAICAAAVGSPAYGAGAQDQRGLIRPVGAHCDTGAFEFLPPVLYLPYLSR